MRLIIVDSIPILDLPPSKTYFNFFPNSSITSCFVTGLIPWDIFALGAAKGKLNFFIRVLVNGCFGNLTAS